MSATARRARLLAAAAGEYRYMDNSEFDALLDAVFHEGPTFRMGFDAHVRAWRANIGKTAMRTYKASPAFRAAYYARGGQFQRSCP